MYDPNAEQNRKSKEEEGTGNDQVVNETIADAEMSEDVTGSNLENVQEEEEEDEEVEDEGEGGVGN